jgi:hypothetical protein
MVQTFNLEYFQSLIAQDKTEQALNELISLLTMFGKRYRNTDIDSKIDILLQISGHYYYAKKQNMINAISHGDFTIEKNKIRDAFLTVAREVLAINGISSFAQETDIAKNIFAQERKLMFQSNRLTFLFGGIAFACFLICIFALLKPTNSTHSQIEGNNNSTQTGNNNNQGSNNSTIFNYDYHPENNSMVQIIRNASGAELARNNINLMQRGDSVFISINDNNKTYVANEFVKAKKEPPVFIKGNEICELNDKYYHINYYDNIEFYDKRGNTYHFRTGSSDLYGIAKWSGNNLLLNDGADGVVFFDNKCKYMHGEIRGNKIRGTLNE